MVSPDAGANLEAKGPNQPASLKQVHFAMGLVQFGFAGSYILSKLSFTSGVNKIVFSVYRDILGLALIAPVGYFLERGKRPPLDWNTLAMAALLAFIGVLGGQILLTFGLSMAPVEFSFLTSTTVPIFTFIIAATFGLEVIEWRRPSGQAKIGGVISACFGGLLAPLYQGPVILGLSLGADARISELQLDNHAVLARTFYLRLENWQVGGILLILSALTLATYLNLQVKALRRYPAPISLLSFTHFFGSIMITALGLLTIEDRSVWRITQVWGIIAVIYVGVVSSGITFTLQTWSLWNSGPVLIAAYTPLQSFVTICVAYLFLGESIHLGSIIGMFLVISGLFLITWGSVRSRMESGLVLRSLAALDATQVVKGDFNPEERLLGLSLTVHFLGSEAIFPTFEYN